MPTLTQKIQKEIPSLMELSEGCRIKGKRSGEIYTILKEREHPFYLCLDKSFDQFNIETDLCYIIGHEPQLNHVLKYLQIITKNDIIYANRLHYLLTNWNLESNLLSEQPKPLLEWLDKIE